MISIITVCYNSINEIKSTLKSCEEQTWKGFQHIIVDGGSTDGSLELIKDYCIKVDNAFYVSEKDDGIYNAMNKSLKMNKNKWVLFLNAGDTFYNYDTLFSMSKILPLRPNSTIVYGGVSATVDNEKYESYQKLFSKMILKNICHQTVFYNVEVLGKELEYDEKYKLCADFELLLRIYLKFGKSSISMINVMVSNYLPGGVSDKQEQLRLTERYDIIKNKKINKFIKIPSLINCKRLMLRYALRKKQ